MFNGQTAVRQNLFVLNPLEILRYIFVDLKFFILFISFYNDILTSVKSIRQGRSIRLMASNAAYFRSTSVRPALLSLSLANSHDKSRASWLLVAVIQGKRAALPASVFQEGRGATAN